MVMDRATPFLPQEIITNILIRLPVKSLIRFQCVCKHWKNLFKTPSFIQDHLHHSSNQNPLLLCDYSIRYYPSQRNVVGRTHLNLLDREMQLLQLDVRMIAPLIDSLYRVRIIGSSNGLICVKIDDSLFLWNPAIREVRQLPPTMNNDFKRRCPLGFGFSPIVNDYMIVRTYTDAEIQGMVQQVEVYSLSTGSWSKVECGIIHRVILGCQTVTANGVIFWHGTKLGVVEEGEDHVKILVSFDIAMKLFALIPWPALDSNSNRKLTVYENKLAVFSAIRIGNLESSLIDLWVLEDGIDASGERWSWHKKYSISPFPPLLYPKTIWRNYIVCDAEAVGMPGLVNETEGEVENDEVKLVLFNLTTNEFKMFAIHRRRLRRRCILNYAESLVPVGNFHIEER